MATYLIHNSGEQTMIYPASTAALEAQFFECIQQDDFESGDYLDDGFSSVRSFIRKFGKNDSMPSHPNGISSYSGAVTMDMTFGDFLARRIPNSVGGITLASLAMRGFCTRSIRMLALRHLKNTQNYTTTMSLFTECGATNEQDWVDALSQPQAILEISAALYKQMVEQLRHRTLRSFFLENRVVNGFSFIGNYCESGCGIPMPAITLPVKDGTVAIKTSLYNEDVGTDQVSAFEWHTALRRSDEQEDDVRACGMIYRFRRREGIAVATRLDLMLASDAVADVDVFQVHSFLTQHDDAEDVFKKSDLCFVWLWERRDGAPKGQGATCLSATLKALQKRYKNLHTVVLNIRPRQFLDWLQRDEMAEIALEKQASVEALATYIRRLNLDKVDVRFIFDQDEGDNDAALRIMREEYDLA